MNIPDLLGVPDYEFRVVVGRTRVDYDPDKESENRSKHGYSLESAVSLLENAILPISGVPLITTGAFLENQEVRHMHMSLDDAGHVVLMVTTMRENETVRVISFRRASVAERRQFLELTGHNGPGGSDPG